MLVKWRNFQKGREDMKRIRVLTAAILVIAVSFAFTPFFGSAGAASKKNVTIVKSMNISFKSDVENLKSKSTIKYKKGFITGYKDIEGSYKLSYDKKYRIKKCVGKISDLGTRTGTYTWKKNKLEKIDLVFDLYNETSKFTYKGGKISKCDLNYEHGGATGKETITFNYKKGHISKKVRKMEGNITYTDIISFDKNKNAVKRVEKIDGKVQEKWSVNIKYGKNKKPEKLVAVCKNSENTDVITYKYTFKYKKVKVAKKYVKAIKEQQWKLINSAIGESYAW